MKIVGVSHIHSSYSYDADMSLAELKVFFKENGIQFALMTEHTDELTKDKARLFVEECSMLSDKDFVFVSGFEVPYKDAHILMFGAEKFVVSHADEGSLLRWRSVTPFSILAHPHRNSFAVDDVLKGVIDGVEIWNSHYDGKHVLRPKSLRLLKDLRGDKKQFAFAGLDFHRKEHFGGPQITMDVEEISTDTILQNLLTSTYKLEKDTVCIGPDGVTHGNSFLFSCKSALLIGFIACAKKLNSFLATLNLSLPKKLKEYIRSKI